MTISELIQQLEVIRSTHGDMPVAIHSSDYGAFTVELDASEPDILDERLNEGEKSEYSGFALFLARCL